MDTKRFFEDRINESIAVKQNLVNQINVLETISEKIIECMKNNSTLYLCGNGGSAADAQHVAAEFIGRFNRDRRPLPAEALTTNTSILSAIGNDYSFEEIFSRQVKGRILESDILVGISTSGKSKNILKALEVAKLKGSTTIGFTGKNSETMEKLCDITLAIPSDKTPRIQEAHILAWHVICDFVEEKLFSKE